jgi:predicted P-loop ATPase
MGYRRFAVIELDSISHDYAKLVDVDQLWAEAYVLYKNADFNFEWNMDDFQSFREYNTRYLIETNAFMLIKEYYRLPFSDDIPIHKQPIEIIQDLRKARKISSSMNNITDVSIGLALRNIGFEHKSKKNSFGSARYGYLVVPLF